MLTKLLHSHIDEMDSIEEQAKNEIDSIIASIDIKELMKNPSEYMHSITEEIRNIMVEKYMSMASKQGFDLGSSLLKLEKQDKTISIDGRKESTLNENIL